MSKTSTSLVKDFKRPVRRIKEVIQCTIDGTVFDLLNSTVKLIQKRDPKVSRSAVVEAIISDRLNGADVHRALEGLMLDPIPTPEVVTSSK